jgi:hypothetical protein
MDLIGLVSYMLIFNMVYFKKRETPSGISRF